MSELSDTAQKVLQSLEEKPTLNTPSLIAMGPVVPDEIDKPEIEAALDELVASGKVKHGATGWKLA
jgi:hypothetical protein